MMKPNTTNNPSFIEPMKALPVEKLPEGDWVYEIKFDGYRALALKEGKDVRLVSRNKKAFDYPQLLAALKKLPADSVILDGEIAALDEIGRSSFQLLQLFKKSGNVPLVYYIFDLLSLEGKDLRDQPLSARRQALANVLKGTISGFPISSAAAMTSLSALQKSLASRDWSLRGKPSSTKAVGAAVPGSNSRSLRARNPLSAGTHSLKAPAATSAPCWSATTVRMVLSSPGESAPDFQKKPWRIFTGSSRNSDRRRVPSSTCRRRAKADGGWGLHLRS